MNQSRTELLIGADGVNRLARKSVLVVGVGGVGGYCLEALVRAGVGAVTAVDGDLVAESNLNRQILATRDTVGQMKAEAAKRRAIAVNEQISFTAVNEFWAAEKIAKTDFSAFDFIVDCIDTVPAKLALAEQAVRQNVPIVSVMGSGNKLVTDFRAEDLAKTTACPLARVMRRELSSRGIKHLPVIFSPTPTVKVVASDRDAESQQAEPAKIHTVGSISYAPGIAGLKAAEFVIIYFLDGGHER